MLQGQNKVLFHKLQMSYLPNVIFHAYLFVGNDAFLAKVNSSYYNYSKPCAGGYQAWTTSQTIQELALVSARGDTCSTAES